MSSSSGDVSSSDSSSSSSGDSSSTSSRPPPSSSGGSSSGDSSTTTQPKQSKGGNQNNGDNGKSSKSDGKSDSSGRDSNSKSPPVDGSSGHSSLDSSMKGLPSSNDNHKAVIAGVAASTALLLIIMILCCICCCRKRKRRHNKYYRENPHPHRHNGYYNDMPHANNWYTDNDGMVKPPGSGGGVSSNHSWMSGGDMSSGYSGPHGAARPSPHRGIPMGGYNQGCFTYNDLAAATNGFSQANLLGQGGFGFVYKGVLPNGKEIAVKSLKSNSGQGEREFQAEVEIISRVHHRHLVSLVGYCIAGTQRMLAYEYVPNGTLEYHLHGAGRPTMEWATRLKIALGAAKGFAYLHEDCNPRIIHRDIKTANILLDLQYEAKVADFGLAKLSSETNTHVSTRIMGTFGYLAPEYASTGKLTEKSDVYSFGVVLLELITGRRPIDPNRDDDEDTLVDWARPILIRVQEGGSFKELVDPRLGDNYDHHEMLRTIHCTAASIQQSSRRRPTMSKLVRVLEGDVSLEDLNEGVKGGAAGAMLGSSVSDTRSSSNQSSSQEFSSGEHGEHVHSGGDAVPSPNFRYPPAGP